MIPMICVDRWWKLIFNADFWGWWKVNYDQPCVCLEDLDDISFLLESYRVSACTLETLVLIRVTFERDEQTERSGDDRSLSLASLTRPWRARTIPAMRAFHWKFILTLQISEGDGNYLCQVLRVPRGSGRYLIWGHLNGSQSWRRRFLKIIETYLWPASRVPYRKLIILSQSFEEDRNFSLTSLIYAWRIRAYQNRRYYIRSRSFHCRFPRMMATHL